MFTDAKQLIICACGILGIFAVGIVYIVFLQRENSKLTLENTNLTVNLQQAKKTLETQKTVNKTVATTSRRARQTQQAVETTNKQECAMEDFNKTMDELNNTKGFGYQK